MSKRLAFLEKITGEGSKDPFAWYGLAMEYAGLGRPDDALATFGKLRALVASNLPPERLLASLLTTLGEMHRARPALSAMMLREAMSGGEHLSSEALSHFVKVFGMVREIVDRWLAALPD